MNIMNTPIVHLHQLSTSFLFLNISHLRCVITRLTCIPRHARRTGLLVSATEGSRPSIERLAETHSTKKYQTQDREVRQLAEDYEQKCKSLIGCARPVVDIVVEHDNLRDVEGVPDPDDGENHEDERAEDALGVCHRLRYMLARNYVQWE